MRFFYTPRERYSETELAEKIEHIREVQFDPPVPSRPYEEVRAFVLEDHRRGLVLTRGRSKRPAGNWKFAYGVGHGWGKWLPWWLKQQIVQRWNRLACALTTHDDTGWHINELCKTDPQRFGIPHEVSGCQNCSKEITACLSNGDCPNWRRESP